MKSILTFLPRTISNQINKIPPALLNEIEEIRVRVNRSLEISTKGLVAISSLYRPTRRCSTFTK